MSDAKLRQLERAEPAGASWLRELQRSGKLSESKLLLMAFCGHPGAKVLMAEEIEKETGLRIGWSNASWIKKGSDPKWSADLQPRMEKWAEALMDLAPSRKMEVSCGDLGPEGCVDHPTDPCDGPSCAGKVREREIGGIWLGTLALVAAAKAALPLLREARRGWSDDVSMQMEWCIKRAEKWLADPVEKNIPRTNPCGGDWGDVTEAWGGLAPLIWERYQLGRPLREFVREYGEDAIRPAVEAKIIEWALEGV
jgi:hypothetical protein